MKKIMLLIAIVFFIGGQLLYAQTKEISGVVTNSEDGSTIPGASVVAVGTTLGTVTDIDGNFSLIVPNDAQTLMVSFVGMKTLEVPIGSQTSFQIALVPDVFGLDEVVVAGVASGTPRKKLSISVGKVGEEELKQVPASSAAGALQGKVSGVTIVKANGNPGSAASIRLRGATALRGGQDPLIIIDGVMLEGTLQDINVDDISSMEVVKGAAASALYGSRAGNGVIVITTKRGEGLAAGQTIVTVRNEYGHSGLAKQMDISTHHYYKLKDDWATETRFTKYLNTVMYGELPEHTDPNLVGTLVSGSRLLDDDHYMDNPFGVVHDHLSDFYSGGSFYTNYVSVASNMNRTKFMVSFENSDQQGIIHGVNGYKRKNFRLNVDHRFSDKFTFTTSNLIVKAETDNSSIDFFSLMQLQPDMNLHAKNPDGTDYRLKVDQFGTTLNPLYPISQVTSTSYRNRLLSSYGFTYTPANWMSVEGMYSFEKQDNYSNYMEPKGYLTLDSYDSGGTGGYMSKGSSQQMAQVVQLTANFNKQFGDWTTKAKLSYLYEDNHWESFGTSAYIFSVNGIPQFNVMDQSTSTNNSSEGDIRAENIFGILDVDYKSKYIGSFLYRYDGASQFGENEKWNPYFRASGAYRITEDFPIEGISELKIRAAYGTSGNRPPWNAQYETFNISGGTPVKNQLGNKNLKPSKILEQEVGLNMEFLKKFEFEFVWSKTDAKDQHWPVPLPASQGYKTQWQNMGTLTSNVLEATLGARLVEKKDFLWKLSLTWDRVRQEITQLDVAPFTTGARGNSGDPGAFFIREGAVFGSVFGEYFLRSMDEMKDQLALLGETKYAGKTIDDFTQNCDGYIIPKGTEGTYKEIPVKKLDANGNPETTQIGDMNPDFHMGIANTVSWKGLDLYVLLDWKQGGDIYSLTNQWMYRDDRGADMDQFGKPENQKKTYDYYKALYNVNTYNNHFVEDGTYLKVREVSLYYNVSKSVLNKVLGGFIKEFKVGVIGRNLLTFTNYSGYDPEVGSTEGSGDNTIQAWDEFAYPNYRTLTGSIEFKF
ncbi:MAG: SusC/RagA family TonB-linked outer membrane protein [Prolixibacteraceae bacterium]|nr:SusC/RagA family TonB-linked outer membrane protein [Prolixibacteraceae bacterium]MBN2773427.1 SusC/RagA family TonB-linked outer membrane protein [Prolixibacteraceae bacterium]